MDAKRLVAGTLLDLGGGGARAGQVRGRRGQRMGGDAQCLVTCTGGRGTGREMGGQVRVRGCQGLTACTTRGFGGREFLGTS